MSSIASVKQHKGSRVPDFATPKDLIEFIRSFSEVEKAQLVAALGVFDLNIEEVDKVKSDDRSSRVI